MMDDMNQHLKLNSATDLDIGSDGPADHPNGPNLSYGVEWYIALVHGSRSAIRSSKSHHTYILLLD